MFSSGCLLNIPMFAKCFLLVDLLLELIALHLLLMLLFDGLHVVMIFMLHVALCCLALHMDSCHD